MAALATVAPWPVRDQCPERLWRDGADETVLSAIDTNADRGEANLEPLGLSGGNALATMHVGVDGRVVHDIASELLIWELVA